MIQERQWAIKACRLSPLLGVACWAFAARYLLFVLYLKPIPSSMDWFQAFWWKPALIIGVCGFTVPWVWRFSVNLSIRGEVNRTTQLPVAAGLALIWVCLVCAGLNVPKVRWAFVEWAKLRTPNPSFARNTLFWEAREFEQSAPRQNQVSRVGLIGSSQIYAGTDLGVLAANAPGLVFEKNCLAGFGPIQYEWLEERIAERHFDVVVCWLSEFDFFREDDIPVNRLAWAATSNGCVRLWDSVNRPVFDWKGRRDALLREKGACIDDQWALRGDYANLAMASLVPLWRQREHIRRTLFDYWWNQSAPTVVAGTAIKRRLADVADMATALTSMKQNVGDKRMVSTNFRAFEHFARTLKDQQVRLIVCEGCSHPDAMRAYDANLRQQTQEKLSLMSQKIGFAYVDASRLPTFSESDFADPYHLNDSGSDKFSRWLARYLAQSTMRSRKE